MDAAQNLASLLTQAALRAPEAPALQCGERILSYGELEALSARLTRYLASAAPGTGARIGILAYKSPEYVAAMQAVLRLDGVYVPMDPKHPSARLARIAEQCGIRIVIGDEALAQHAGALREAGVEHLLDFACIPIEVPEVSVTAPLRGRNDVAYILFTSGSTGNPKGVPLTHGHALNLVAWTCRHYGLRSDDCLLNHCQFTFDLPVFDLYGGFLAGAKIVLVPESDALFPASTAKLIEQRKITSLMMVPSALIAVMTRGGLLARPPGPLRRILYSGEAFPVPALARLREWAGRETVIGNLYGPIETNYCMYYDVPAYGDLGSSIPIGRPIANVEARIVGDDGEPCGEGHVGEIWVSGICVTPGYLNADAAKAEKFAMRDGKTWYRTGDLGSVEQGQIRFHGRRDYMVKVRGFRIELGEVEHALLKHASVSEAAVVAVPDREQGNVLHAWFVPKATSADADSLKSHLSEILPGYMIPKSISPLERMPKTDSGKINRLALQATLDPGGRE